MQIWKGFTVKILISQTLRKIMCTDKSLFFSTSSSVVPLFSHFSSSRANLHSVHQQLHLLVTIFTLLIHSSFHLFRGWFSPVNETFLCLCRCCCKQVWCSDFLQLNTLFQDENMAKCKCPKQFHLSLTKISHLNEVTRQLQDWDWSSARPFFFFLQLHTWCVIKLWTGPVELNWKRNSNHRKVK